MKKKLIYSALASMMLFASCTGSEDTKTDDTRTKVRVDAIQKKQVSKDLSFNANLEANETVAVSPTLQGARIRKLYVEVGDRIAKGQKLLELDATNLQQSKLQLANIETEYNRALKLKETESISQQAFDQIETQYNVTKTAIQTLIENTTMVAPFSGYVTARNQDEGELYMGSPIYTVEQINPMKAKVNIAEQYYTLVKKGMKVTMTSDVYPGRTFEGMVSIVAPSIDVKSRTFQVELLFNNGDEALRPGMYGSINFSLGIENRVVVPSIAVLKVQGSNERYLFVEREGKSVRIGVKVVKRFEDMVAIEPYAGQTLSEGEKLVVVGQANCVDGGEIVVVE
ncbi:MAG: efflux RND transporter periplasmic adaptor subunit [Marinilabiliaceae bacterium]|nr:efflux RND transporter periplasmic adaptor subunit [Marinilabiliaceae bacterium]